MKEASIEDFESNRWPTVILTLWAMSSDPYSSHKVLYLLLKSNLRLFYAYLQRAALSPLSRLLHALFAAIYNQFLSLRTSPPFTCIFGHLVSFVASLNGAFFPVAFSNSNCGCFPRNFAAMEALFAAWI